MGPVTITELRFLEHRDGTRVLQYRTGHYGRSFGRPGDLRPNWVGFDWQDVPVVRECEVQT